MPMMPRSARMTRGFTIVETMVTSTIFLSVGLMAVMWLNGASDLWWTTNTQAHVRETAHLAVNRMVFELRMGTRVGAGSPPNVAIPAAPNNTSITFYLPADLDPFDGNTTIVDALGDIEWDAANPVQYTYVPAQRQLLRVAGAQQTVIASDVTAARFDDAATDPTLGLNEVKVTITVQRLSPQQRTLSATSTEIVKFRN